MYQKVENFIKNTPVWILLVLYLTIHIMIRLGFSSTLQVDDSEQVYFAQNLRLGYPIPQPPLYTWLTWIFFKVFGPSLFALTVLKYSLIGLTFYFIHKTSVFFTKDKYIQNLIVLSYLLMPSFFWHMHQGFTHTILLGLAISSTFYYSISIISNDKYIDYFFLGASIAIGVLSKYSYLIFIFLLFVTLISKKDSREIFFNKKILISLFVALILQLPHMYWVFENFQNLFLSVDEKLSINQSSSVNNFFSLLNLFKSSIGFISPLIFVFIISFFRGKKNQKENNTSPNINLEIIELFFKVLIIFSILTLLFFTIPHVKVRWLHPLLMLFPFWVFIKLLNRGKIDLLTKKIFIYFLIIITILVLFIRLIQVTVGPDFGIYGRLNRPIITALNKIPKKLLDQSTIATNDAFIASHLLINFRNRILYRKEFFNTGEESDKCLWVWDNDDEQLFVEPELVTQSSRPEQIIIEFKNKSYILAYKAAQKC